MWCVVDKVYYSRFFVENFSLASDEEEFEDLLGGSTDDDDGEEEMEFPEINDMEQGEAQDEDDRESQGSWEDLESEEIIG